jgi:hypothetical protein
MDVLVSNDQVVRELRATLSEGKVLEEVPGLIRRLLEEGGWRERREKTLGRVVSFDRFAEFITTDPLEGLGFKVGEIEAILGARDRDVLKMFQRETEQPLDDHGGSRTEQDYNISLKGSGTAEGYTRRRLRRDRPDLYERVVEGELSSNAAAIEAGFRKPTRTVPIDSVENAVRALARWFDVEQIRQAVKRLDE